MSDSRQRARDPRTRDALSPRESGVHERAAIPAAAPEPAPAPAAPFLLVVDPDDLERVARVRAIRRVLPVALVRDAAGARAAIERHAHAPPAGLVVHHDLPDGAGLALILALRQAIDAHLPALLISSRSDASLARDAAALSVRLLPAALLPSRAERELGRFAILVRVAPVLDAALHEYARAHDLSPAREALVRSSLLIERAHLASAHGRSESTTRGHISSINERCGTEDLRDVLEDVLLHALTRVEPRLE
jgi:hypothetical protein